MSQREKTVLLCAPKRTAIGSFQGSLAGLSVTQLGTHAVKAVLEESKVDPETVQEVILGCVLAAGAGQAPARQVVIRSGMPTQVQAMTINKVCSSGLKAIMLAADRIQLGYAEAVIAGGMESMSQAPYILPSLRSGARMGTVEAQDTLIHDALWDVYNNFHMGNAAELCAKECHISREEQDSFAIESYKRASNAIQAGFFRKEISGIEVPVGKDKVIFDTDEEPGKAKLEKIPSLRPVFQKDGTVTAANASSINDGSAAMLVCSEEYANKHHLHPMGRIVSQGWYGQAPEWFTTAPVGAMEMALKRASWTVAGVDLFEVNEAFSAVALACGSKLGLPPEKLNVSGGAVALGHPVGASGARILVTLLHNLERLGQKKGGVAICNGGGEATAMLVERV